VDRAAALWRADHQGRYDGEGTPPAVTGMAAIGPVWEWENLADEVDASRLGALHVGGSSVEMLRSARTRYEHMYRQVGGVATRSRIVRFLNEQTGPLLRGSLVTEWVKNFIGPPGDSSPSPGSVRTILTRKVWRSDTFIKRYVWRRRLVTVDSVHM